ncbi:MAG: ABC transporter permease [Chitinophagales bacterium]
MDLKLNISLAFRAIRANRLRSVITIIIIAFGLMALVGILTAIDALKSSINSNFTTLGANSFSIKNFNELSDGDEAPKPPISYKEAHAFKDAYSYSGSVVSISNIFIQGTATVKHGEKKTNPNVLVAGVDENYISVLGYTIGEGQGRGFSAQELEGARRVVVLGSDVAEKIFTQKENPVDNSILINGQYFRVIGVLKSKGSSFMQSDNRVLIPLTAARSIFPSNYESYNISVSVRTPEDMDAAIGDATGLMRQVRKLKIEEDDDFLISKSDSVVNVLSII